MGDDYSAQVFTLTRLMNKVPEPAEQSWTNQLSPPENLGGNDSPSVAATATPDNREIDRAMDNWRCQGRRSATRQRPAKAKTRMNLRLTIMSPPNNWHPRRQ